MNAKGAKRAKNTVLFAVFAFRFRSKSRLEVDAKTPALRGRTERADRVELEHESGRVQAHPAAGAAQILRRPGHPEPPALGKGERLDRQRAVAHRAAQGADDRKSHFEVGHEKA